MLKNHALNSSCTLCACPQLKLNVVISVQRGECFTEDSTIAAFDPFAISSWSNVNCKINIITERLLADNYFL